MGFLHVQPCNVAGGASGPQSDCLIELRAVLLTRLAWRISKAIGV